MKQYGDIRELCGAELEPVDCVIGGSPCQDLSVAGKRSGLKGERSGLFMEQVRIIKEMREEDRKRGRSGIFVRPRYMVWENVPGALSSRKGADFRIVLEETARVAEPCAAVPEPSGGGKWSTSGCIMGDGFSIAWRILDARFWGVPQRRRRIALVADFGGASAPEILFVRKSLSWNPEAGGKTEETTSSSAGNGAAGCDCAGGCAGSNGYKSVTASIQYEEDTAPTIEANMPPNVCYCIQGNCIDRADTAGCNGRGWTEDVSYTMNTVDRPAVVYGFNWNAGSKAKGVGAEKDTSPTIKADGGHPPAIVQVCPDKAHTMRAKSNCAYAEDKETYIVCMGTGQANAEILKDTSATLNCNHEQPIVFDCRGNGDGETVPTLTGDHENRVTDYSAVILPAVRRLTPLECERLQGYPDNWTNIPPTKINGKTVKPSDSARYKALGNSIALPPWKWVLKRLCAQYERDATLGSLFDGIGGFPLIWERLNGKGSCRWISEIEAFPLAVTKYHFEEEP